MVVILVRRRTMLMVMKMVWIVRMMFVIVVIGLMEMVMRIVTIVRMGGY